GLALFARPIVSIFTDQEDVIRTAIPLVHIAVAFQLFDGAQVTAAGALRGAGDTRFIQWANVVGHYAIGLPLAVVLAFWAGMNERGLWIGLSAGLIVVALSLTIRFHRV